MSNTTARIIRSYGDWELVILDLASSERLYVNKATGDTSESLPLEVKQMQKRMNQRQGARQVRESEPTNFCFKLPLHKHAQSMNLEDGGSDCVCCSETGFVEGIGTCPLCDGCGAAGWQVESFLHTVVERVDLPSVSGNAFALQGFLSHVECSEIIEQAETFGLRSVDYDKKIRVTDRVCIKSSELASLLFQRAKPYLADIDVWRHGGSLWPLGIRDDAMPGVWSATGLNPLFRVCKYEPGGFFLPHKDGGHKYSREHLSLTTFMMYLNGEFEGGPTTFYKQSQQHYAAPDPSKKIYEYHPQVGSCLVFNHCLVHDGGVLQKGTKYLLRTEVMYEWRGRRQVQ